MVSEKVLENTNFIFKNFLIKGYSSCFNAWQYFKEFNLHISKSKWVREEGAIFKKKFIHKIHHYDQGILNHI